MKNFKEIAEKCLAGELSGTFILQDGNEVKSNYLRKLPPTTSAICSYSLYGWYISDNGNAYGDTGYLYSSSIKNFISDNMQKQIKIDIPEGKVPVMEQTEKGVVITWKKELEYNDIFNYLWEHKAQIGLLKPLVENENTDKFNEKVNVLCKLTNIRNYFGKPDENEKGWIIEQGGIRRTICESKYNVNVIVFAKKEHAEQAIKMLGDELKYLFEPW